jgi:hypothetical protein
MSGPISLRYRLAETTKTEIQSRFPSCSLVPLLIHTCTGKETIKINSFAQGFYSYPGFNAKNLEVLERQEYCDLPEIE